MSVPTKLVYSIPDFVFAIGDKNRLDVQLSVLVEEGSPAREPLRQFVEEHGLVLYRTHKAEVSTVCGGEARMDIYGQPSFRRDGEELPDRIDMGDFSDEEVISAGVWFQNQMVRFIEQNTPESPGQSS